MHVEVGIVSTRVRVDVADASEFSGEGLGCTASSPARPPGAVRHCGHRLLGNRADDVVDSRPLFRRADQRVDAHILWARQREVEASDMRA